MNDLHSLGETLGAAAATLLDRLVAYFPSAVGATLLVVVGWISARLLRAVAVRAAMLLDRLLGQVPRGARLRMNRAPAVLGAVVFWVVLLFFVTAATQVLGLQTFTDWLARLIDYLPTLAAGALIVAAGYVLSRFAADLVEAAATPLGAAQRGMLARLAQFAILTGAVLVGADQIGIKVTFLAIFVAALAAAVVGTLAVAVGLGARDYVANLIGTHHLRQAFSIGQTVRVGTHEGRIVDVTATVLVLETDHGRVTVPGRAYNEQAIELLMPNRHE